MTISSQTIRNDYTGNGSTTVFPYTFRILAASELKVVVRDDNDVETTKVLNTDYTVSGVGTASGGNVTFMTAPVSGYVITIISNAPYTQTTDIRNQGSFFPSVHEDAFDKIVRRVQQLREKLTRAFQLPESVSASNVDTTLPVPAANKVVAWNENADALVNVDAESLATIVASGNIRVDTFSGDGADTTFTLTSNGGSANNLQVFIDGVHQKPSTDYTLSGTLVTFTTAPPIGTNNIVIRYGSVVEVGIPPDGSVTYAKLAVDLQAVASVSDLLGLVGAADGQCVELTSYYSGLGKGGGRIEWDSSSTATHDGGKVFKPTSVTAAGRWLRLVKNGVMSLSDWGCVLDDSTDDAAAFQAALDSVGDTSLHQRSGLHLVLDGPMVIKSTVTSRRKSIRISASGWGRREDTNPNRPYIRWDGAAGGTPMLKVQDITNFNISGVRFIGKSTAKPSAALNFNESNDSIANTGNCFENIWIGGGLDNADDAEQFTVGLLLDGALNANNSEFLGRNLYMYKCGTGMHVGRQQNVNIKIDGFYPQQCTSSGLSNCGQVQLSNVSCYLNAKDFFSPATDDGGTPIVPRYTITGYLSESSARMLETLSSCNFLVQSGTFQITSSLNADGKLVKAEGNTGVSFSLRDFWFLPASAPPTPAYLSMSPTNTGYRTIHLHNVNGWGNLAGGTNGMDLQVTGVTSRVYVDFTEDPQTTSFSPIRKAVNFIQGISGRQWDIKRHDIWNFTSLRLMDDFLGDVLADEWGSLVGTDPQCVAPAILADQPGGAMRMTTGDDAGGTMALNGVQFQSALNWDAEAGSLVFETRVKITNPAGMCLFLGFTDQVAALEMPIQASGVGDGITTNATDAVGVMFDNGMATDNWWFVGVANNVDAATQNSGFAPTGAYETWRIEIAGNVATFFRNGVSVGSAMTNDIRNKPVTPVVAAFSKGAGSATVTLDYVYVQQNRQ